MVSNAIALTNQFYQWERRGRGWTVAKFSCDLEPVFVPFFGHFIEQGEIIDDGKHPSFFGTLFLSRTEQDKRPETCEPEEQRAHPYSGASGDLSVYSITLPKQFKQSKER